MKKYGLPLFLFFSFLSSFGQIPLNNDSADLRKRQERLKAEELKNREIQKEIWKKFRDEKLKKEEERIGSAEFAFEGVVVKEELYSRFNHGMASLIIRIDKVFRGNLKLGTVEIVFELPEGILYPIKGREKVNLNAIADTVMVSFCKTSKEYLYDSKYNIDKVDNKVLLTFYPEDLCFIMNSNDRTWTREGIVYSSKGVLYNYLRKFDGLNIPLKAEKIIEKRSMAPAVIKSPAKLRSDSILRERDKRYQLLFEKKKLKSSKLKSATTMSSASSTFDAAFSMANFKTTDL